MHWLPKSWHRAILSSLGYSYYCTEENLNLMDKRDLGRTGEALADFNRAVHSASCMDSKETCWLAGKRRNAGVCKIGSVIGTIPFDTRGK
jgi:hypothetical protein